MVSMTTAMDCPTAMTFATTTTSVPMKAVTVPMDVCMSQHRAMSVWTGMDARMMTSAAKESALE
jgi:hypothetical protein